MVQSGTADGKPSRYDLEERTFLFAKEVTMFCRDLPTSTSNTQYVKQLLRSSGSIGANYVEANEALGKKDLVLRMRIARKEAKESAYWLRLIAETNNDFARERASILRTEAIELKRIFSSIVNKLK
jgi:four helix bundle protein